MSIRSPASRRLAVVVLEQPTVLGIVGAGGIGMELKGCWDLADYGHVSTILLIIFITVLALEHLTQRLRRRLI